MTAVGSAVVEPKARQKLQLQNRVAPGKSESGQGHPPLLRIGAFPPGEAIWRVDWFGDLSYPARSQRSNQPSVTIWLSKVVGTRWSESQAVPLDPDFTRHKERIHRRVALGTLVILRLGDLWRNQQLVARPQYEVEQFDDIDVVGDHHVEIIKAGLSMEDGSFVLPASEHPWHMGATHSYCAQVRMSDGRFMVIPALELARFYFGTSSALLVKLFSPEFTKDSICTGESMVTSERGPIAELSLAPGIPAASAHDVARLVFGTKSLARASLLSRSCLRASIARETIFPQCAFPFLGKTDLKVKGKWLSREGVARRTFVVYEILSCSHPFPYRELRFRVNPGGAGADRWQGATSLPVAATVADKTRPSGRLNHGKGLQELDPGRSLTAKVVRVPLTERFPDLRFKRAMVQEADSASTAPEPRQGRTDDEGFSIGDPSGAGTLRAVELAEAEPRQRPPPVPEFLRPVIAALRKFDGIASILTASAEDNFTIGVDQIPGLEITKHHPSYYLDSRPRRFCVADLRKGHLRHLMAVCEGRPSTILVTPWIDEVGDYRRAIPMAMMGLMNIWQMLSGEVAPRDSGNAPPSAKRIAEHLQVHFMNCATSREQGGPTTLIQ